MTTGLPSVERLIHLFSRFPGVGRKSAQRMVYHLLRSGHRSIEESIHALKALRDNIRSCTACFNLSENELCRICRDPGRDLSILCVVEEPADLFAMEHAGVFKGGYHVLGGRLSPLDGIGPDDLTCDALIARLKRGDIQEIVLATNPTVEGEATAHYVSQLAHGIIERVTRLAYGLPMGGELEYLDESTLYQAFSGRRNY